MFRRRTDHVYSTLQQVQRRITEQTGGPPPTPSQPRPAPDSERYSRPTDHFTPASPTPAVIPPPSHSHAFPGLGGAPRNDGIVLALPMLILLGLLTLVLCVVSFLVGRLTAPDKSDHGFAPGAAGTRDTTPRSTETPAQKRYILTLGTAVERPTPVQLEALERLKNSLNTQIATERWQTLDLNSSFDIYESTNGSKVVAFGWNGRWNGVDQTQDKYQVLMRALEKNYRPVVWVPVR